MAMPNAALAARIRTEILERPEHYDQGSWVSGDVLRPEEDLTAAAHCETTLCVAGYAAHFTGHIVLPIGYAVRPGDEQEHQIREVARTELGLTEAEAAWLFHGTRTCDEVLAALGQLADGAPRIDIAATAAVQGV